MTTLEDKRIVVLGAGAIGGLLAAQLTHAGEKAVLWGRAPALSAIAAHGITLTGSIELTCDVETVAGPIPRAGLYLVATKSPANRELIEQMVREIPPHSRVLVCQNGLDPERIFVERLGADRVFRAVFFLGAKRHTATDIEVVFWNGPTRIGGVDGACAEEIAERLTRAGHPAEATAELSRYVWEKVILNAITNPLCAVEGRTIDQAMKDPRFLPLLHEAIAVATASGVDLGPDFEAEALRLTAQAGAHRGSMWEDVQAGRPTEIDQMNGRIVELGERFEVPTPTHRQLLDEIHGLVLERGA